MECTNLDHAQLQMRLEALEEENKTLKEFADLASHAANYVLSEAMESQNKALVDFCRPKINFINQNDIKKAIKGGYGDVVSRYIELKPQSYASAFHYSLEVQQLGFAQIFLDTGRVNINEKFGYTIKKNKNSHDANLSPLEMTVIGNKAKSFEWLLKQKDVETEGALNLACQEVMTFAILKLLEAGVKPVIDNIFRKNTIDYAPKESREKIQKIFDDFAKANQTPDRVVNFEEK